MVALAAAVSSSVEKAEKKVQLAQPEQQATAP